MCTRSSLSHKYNSSLSCGMLTLQQDCTSNNHLEHIVNMQAAIVLFMAFHLLLMASCSFSKAQWRCMHFSCDQLTCKSTWHGHNGRNSYTNTSAGCHGVCPQCSRTEPAITLTTFHLQNFAFVAHGQLQRLQSTVAV